MTDRTKVRKQTQTTTMGESCGSNEVDSSSIQVDDNEQEANRYFMPEYLAWLRSKLPYIALWSMLCVGDMRRYNHEYDIQVPPSNARNFMDENTTNAYAEQFFSMKRKTSASLDYRLINS